ELERILRVGIDPLQVFEHEYEGLAPRFSADQAKIRLERPLPPGCGIEPPERMTVLEGAELPEHSRHTLGELRIDGRHRRADFLPNGLDGVRAVETEVASDDVQAGPVAGGAREGLRG